LEQITSFFKRYFWAILKAIKHIKMSPNSNVEERVNDVGGNTCKQHSAKEKIRIILEGLRGEETIF